MENNKRLTAEEWWNQNATVFEQGNSQWRQTLMTKEKFLEYASQSLTADQIQAEAEREYPISDSAFDQETADGNFHAQLQQEAYIKGASLHTVGEIKK